MISCTFRIFCILLLNVQIVPALNDEVVNILGNNEYMNNFIDNVENNETISQKIANNEQNNVKKNSWFLNVPLLPIVVATSNSIPEGYCKKQLHLYLSHLNNGTLWATESE